MNKIANRFKPTVGFSHFFHYFIRLLFPAVVYIFVRISLPQLAFAVVILSKWRIVAVKPRHWLALIRANAIDGIVGLSVVTFMTSTTSTTLQVTWATLYALWLVFLKPKSSVFMVSLQAAIGQAVGLVAAVSLLGGRPMYVIVPVVWAIAYSSARHFLTSFDENLYALVANIWSFFCAGMAWVCWHWLTYYGAVPQLAIVLSVIGYIFAVLYYFDYSEKLTKSIVRQCLLAIVAFVSVILVFWIDPV